MPKAVLEFTLPTERWAHKMALRGEAYHSALRGLDEHLRGRLKYAELSAATREELQEVRRLLREGVPDLDDE